MTYTAVYKDVRRVVAKRFPFSPAAVPDLRHVPRHTESIRPKSGLPDTEKVEFRPLPSANTPNRLLSRRTFVNSSRLFPKRTQESVDD